MSFKYKKCPECKHATDWEYGCIVCNNCGFCAG